MKMNKNEIPVLMQAESTIVRNLTGCGGMTIAYNEFPKGTDFSPLLHGLNNNSCHCPHWGYVLEGVVRLIYDDKTEEVVKAGDVAASSSLLIRLFTQLRDRGQGGNRCCQEHKDS